jgi:hypothetical protein
MICNYYFSALRLCGEKFFSFIKSTVQIIINRGGAEDAEMWYLRKTI